MNENTSQRSANMRKKLSLGPLPAQVDQYAIDEKVELRWDRILPAGAFALALVGVLWAVVRPDTGAVNPALPEQIAQQPEAETGNTTIVPEVKEPVSETDKAEELAQAINQLPAPAAIAPKQAPLIAPKGGAVEDIVPNLVDAVSAALTLHDKRVAEGYVRSVGSTFDAQRAQGNRLEVPSKGILKMELHAVLKSQQGQELYHQWFRNGKLQAKIKVSVTTPVHDSFSSKYINRQMLGDWQSKVVDASGKVLAQADFTVY